MSVNKAFILGRVGKDPQVSHINDTKKVSFSMATTDRAYTTKAGTQVPEKTEWNNIVADRKSTRLNSSHKHRSRMPSSA